MRKQSFVIPDISKIRHVVVKYPPCFRGDRRHRTILSVHDEYSEASIAHKIEEDKLWPEIREMRMRRDCGEDIPKEEIRDLTNNVYMNPFAPMVRIEVISVDELDTESEEEASGR